MCALSRSSQDYALDAFTEPEPSREFNSSLFSRQFGDVVGVASSSQNLSQCRSGCKEGSGGCHYTMVGKTTVGATTSHTQEPSLHARAAARPVSHRLRQGRVDHQPFPGEAVFLETRFLTVDQTGLQLLSLVKYLANLVCGAKTLSKQECSETVEIEKVKII